MKNLFNFDSPVMRFLTRIADLMLLNILWLICCVPVVTIGASTAAMYHVIFKMETQEEEGIIKTFWQGFRSNFRQATLVFLALIIPFALIVADVLLLVMGVLGDDLITKIACAIPIVVFAMLHSYVYPLTAKFENTVGATIKNALLLSIGNLPFAVTVTVMNLIPVIWMVLSPTSFVQNFVWFLLGGFAWIAYANGKLFYRLFNQLILQKAQEQEAEEAAAHE